MYNYHNTVAIFAGAVFDLSTQLNMSVVFSPIGKRWNSSMLTCIRLRDNYLTTVLLSFLDVDCSRESQGGRRKKYYGSFASGASGVSYIFSEILKLLLRCMGYSSNFTKKDNFRAFLFPFMDSLSLP